MPVKKVKTKKINKAKTQRKTVTKLVLPTELSKPKENLHEYMIRWGVM